MEWQTVYKAEADGLSFEAGYDERDKGWWHAWDWHYNGPEDGKVGFDTAEDARAAADAWLDERLKRREVQKAEANAIRERATEARIKRNEERKRIERERQEYVDGLPSSDW
jgi:hypothetical protein